MRRRPPRCTPLRFTPLIRANYRECSENLEGPLDTRPGKAHASWPGARLLRIGKHLQPGSKPKSCAGPEHPTASIDSQVILTAISERSLTRIRGNSSRIGRWVLLKVSFLTEHLVVHASRGDTAESQAPDA